MIEIIVYGTPGPQGSKKPVGIHGGRHIMIESSAKVKPWRQAVTWAAREAMGALPPIAGPIVADMTFTRQKPIGAPKRRVTYPATAPDLDKLVRSTNDALTDAGIWEDDARVIECTARKVYAGEHPLSLASPGVRITIRGVGEISAVLS